MREVQFCNFKYPMTQNCRFGFLTITATNSVLSLGEANSSAVNQLINIILGNSEFCRVVGCDEQASRLEQQMTEGRRKGCGKKSCVGFWEGDKIVVFQ
ncbi:MAG: hypothetical protein HY231_13935 [Acidobacteria bacterium]|nr:hypothetical protein [Acidobacteriota bacterium]